MSQNQCSKTIKRCLKYDWGRIAFFFSDTEARLFIKIGIRVGMSYIARKCNRLNKICLSNYDENKKSKYLMDVETDNQTL